MCNNLAFAPLVIGATIEQLKTYVEPLITGKEVKFGAFSLTERKAGSDAAAVATRAERDGDDYVINGTKCWITNAPVADLFTVFATTQPELKHKGLSVFMVPKSKNVKIGLIENKVGQLNSQQSEIFFEDVRVPKDCLIGKEGEGFKIAMKTLDKTRAGIAAIATGVAQRALDEAAKFANIRTQFGQPIGRFQGISFTLSDMGARVAASRLMTRYAAWLADRDLPVSKDSAFSKYFSSDAAMQNAIDAIQIFGGYGYIQEYPVEKLMRDAKLLQIYEGTNQVQRLVAGNAILKESRDLDTGFKFKYDGVDAPQL
jgi:alkylation response protein AidB-like acyl-CoA dehydrogenase